MDAARGPFARRALQHRLPKVQGFGLQVSGLRFGVQGLEFWISGLGFGV